MEPLIDKMVHKKEKIKTLIVEDHYIINAAIKELLEFIGCSADIAENGEKAISLYHENKYDIIFMDIGLPDIDGCMLTQKIRAIENRKTHIPIICLSAQCNEAIIKMAIDAGMDDYIPKPLTEKRCIEALIKYVSSNNSKCD